MGPLIPLFWTSGDVCPGLQNQGDPFCGFLPACNRFLRFTSGSTPANLLVASMAASQVPCMYVAEVGCPDSIERSSAE